MERGDISGRQITGRRFQKIEDLQGIASSDINVHEPERRAGGKPEEEKVYR